MNGNEGRGRYTGQGDVNLQLGGEVSLLNEDKIKRQFSISLQNTTGEKQVIALCPGFLSPLGIEKTFQTVTLEDGTATGDVLKDVSLTRKNADKINNEGYDIDHVINDGVLLDNGTGTLEASSPDGNIESFLDYVKFHPQRAVSIDVTVNDRAVLPKHLNIARMYPDHSVSIRKIPVEKFFKPDNSQSTKVIVPYDIQFDAQNLIFFEMIGEQNGVKNTQIEFNFDLGAAHEYGTALMNKVSFAQGKGNQ